MDTDGDVALLYHESGPNRCGQSPGSMCSRRLFMPNNAFFLFLSEVACALCSMVYFESVTRVYFLAYPREPRACSNIAHQSSKRSCEAGFAGNVTCSLVAGGKDLKFVLR